MAKPNKNQPIPEVIKLKGEITKDPKYTCNPKDFEFNTGMIAVIDGEKIHAKFKDGEKKAVGGDKLYALDKDGNCIGVADVLKFKKDNQFYIMIYGHAPKVYGCSLVFFDSKEKKLYTVSNYSTFFANNPKGKPKNPFMLTLAEEVGTEADSYGVTIVDIDGNKLGFKSDSLITVEHLGKQAAPPAKKVKDAPPADEPDKSEGTPAGDEEANTAEGSKKENINP
jgi:hypothetical protein